MGENPFLYLFLVAVLSCSGNEVFRCIGSQDTSHTLNDWISQAAVHVIYIKQGTTGRCQDRQIHIGYQKVLFCTYVFWIATGKQRDGVSLHEK